MTKQIPFYSNIDNNHCVTAVFKSLFEYYCDEKYSWEQLDKLGRAVENKGTWTAPYHLQLAKNGVNVKIIEPFDYQALVKDGLEYLKTLGKAGEYYINRSNWHEVLPLIDEFLEKVEHEKRKAHIEEIDQYLRTKHLVAIELNSRAINNIEGFVLHYVLVKSKENDDYVINDPGGVTVKGADNRRVDRKTLIKAIGGQYAQHEVAIFNKS